MIYDDILHFWSPKTVPVVCTVTNKPALSEKMLKCTVVQPWKQEIIPAQTSLQSYYPYAHGNSLPYPISSPPRHLIFPDERGRSVNRHVLRNKMYFAVFWLNHKWSNSAAVFNKVKSALTSLLFEYRPSLLHTILGNAFIDCFLVNSKVKRSPITN